MKPYILILTFVLLTINLYTTAIPVTQPITFPYGLGGPIAPAPSFTRRPTPIIPRSNTTEDITTNIFAEGEAASSHSQAKPLPMVIGTIIGVVGAIAVLTLVLYCYRHHHEKRHGWA